MKNRFTLSLILFLFFAAGCGDAAQKSDGDYADQMAEQHAEDTPEASPMVQAANIPVAVRDVEYARVDGAAVMGYLAEPANVDSVLQAMGRAPGSGLPGVIVIHEWWGLNDNIRAMTRQLAAEGYRALAVDLYGGEAAGTPDGAQALMMAAMQNPTAAETNLVSAYTYLTNQEHAPTVASIGWCFGGGMSLTTALALPTDLDAAVIYYGRLVDDRDRLATLEMPIIGFFGRDDGGIPVEGVEAFEATLKDLGKDAEVHIYDGAGHAFANPSGQNYLEAAAQDAWSRTRTFLKAHLYGMP